MSVNRPKIVCTTLYDKAYASIGWMSRNTLTRYGQRHGHDVIVARSVECDRPPAWYKVRMVQALFDRGYDYVFWMDADALFTDFSHDIADLIRSDKDMHLVEHHLSWYPRAAPNTGVFLLRNCDWSRDLLDRMWNLEQYIHGVWWENAAFMHLLGQNQFAKQGIHNPNGCEIDADRIEWLPERWNRLPMRLGPGRTIIRHYAGKSKKHRLRNMGVRLNWPKAVRHELSRKPEPLDLTGYEVAGATFEHIAPRPVVAPRAEARAA